MCSFKIQDDCRLQFKFSKSHSEFSRALYTLHSTFHSRTQLNSNNATQNQFSLPQTERRPYTLVYTHTTEHRPRRLNSVRALHSGNFQNNTPPRLVLTRGPLTSCYSVKSMSGLYNFLVRSRFYRNSHATMNQFCHNFFLLTLYGYDLAFIINPSISITFHIYRQNWPPSQEVVRSCTAGGSCQTAHCDIDFRGRER